MNFWEFLIGKKGYRLKFWNYQSGLLGGIAMTGFLWCIFAFLFWFDLL